MPRAEGLEGAAFIAEQSPVGRYASFAFDAYRLSYLRQEL